MARGAAIIKPGQQRIKVKWKCAAPAQRVLGLENLNKVKWKDAAPAQRVPSRENKKQKKDAAQIQKVLGPIHLRVHNDPREGVLDTLLGFYASERGFGYRWNTDHYGTRNRVLSGGRLWPIHVGRVRPTVRGPSN